MLNFLRLVSIVTGASIATILPAQATADVTTWKKVEGWDIGFYENLPGCLAYMPYEGGTHFWIGFIKKDDGILLDVSLMDDAWESIEAGKEYSVKVYFGDETPWTLEMSGRVYDGSPALNFAFDASTEQSGTFAREFMRETGMKWYYRNTMLGHYSLRGSRQAFDEAVACQKSFNEAVAGVSDPFGGSSGGSNSDPFSQ
jgi:hypothetical protein